MVSHLASAVGPTCWMQILYVLEIYPIAMYYMTDFVFLDNDILSVVHAREKNTGNLFPFLSYIGLL